MVSGKKGSGKSTVVTLLREELTRDGIATASLAVADPLKKLASRIFHFPLEWCYTEEGKNRLIILPSAIEVTVRKILQWVAENRYARDAYYWIPNLKRRIKKLEERGYDAVIIDGARFPTELLWGLGLGAIAIRLTRGPHPEDDHISETALDNFNWRGMPKCYILDNANWTLEHQAAQVRELIDVIPNLCLRGAA